MIPEWVMKAAKEICEEWDIGSDPLEVAEIIVKAYNANKHCPRCDAPTVQPRYVDVATGTALSPSMFCSKCGLHFEEASKVKL